VVVKDAFSCTDPELDPRIHDDKANHEVWLEPGEEGISVEARLYKGKRYHRAVFVRHHVRFEGKIE
jgi:hypothetical protein